MSEEADKSSRVKPLVILVVIFIVLLGVGAAGFVYWNYQKHKTEQEENQTLSDETTQETGVSVDETNVGLSYPLNPFTVNLKDGKYLRFTIAIRFSHDIPNAFYSKEYELRDRIISFFNSKASHEIISPDARQDLKKEIISIIKSVIGTSNIDDIYFLELVAQ